jgi:hypothetical protein
MSYIYWNPWRHITYIFIHFIALCFSLLRSYMCYCYILRYTEKRWDITYTSPKYHRGEDWWAVLASWICRENVVIHQGELLLPMAQKARMLPTPPCLPARDDCHWSARWSSTPDLCLPEEDESHRNMQEQGSLSCPPEQNQLHNYSS